MSLVLSVHQIEGAIPHVSQLNSRGQREDQLDLPIQVRLQSITVLLLRTKEKKLRTSSSHCVT